MPRTLTYSFQATFGGNSRGGANSSEPSDLVGGHTLFEAIEKDVGLKLEQRKRSMPVIVIDHLEQKPRI